MKLTEEKFKMCVDEYILDGINVCLINRPIVLGNIRMSDIEQYIKDSINRDLTPRLTYINKLNDNINRKKLELDLKVQSNDKLYCKMMLNIEYENIINKVSTYVKRVRNQFDFTRVGERVIDATQTNLDDFIEYFYAKLNNSIRKIVRASFKITMLQMIEQNLDNLIRSKT